MEENASSNTLHTIQRLLADELDLDPEKLDPALPLVELGIDSLTLIECFFKIEDAFGIKIENSQINPNSIQEIANMIDRLVAARSVSKS